VPPLPAQAPSHPTLRACMSDGLAKRERISSPSSWWTPTAWGQVLEPRHKQPRHLGLCGLVSWWQAVATAVGSHGVAWGRRPRAVWEWRSSAGSDNPPDARRTGTPPLSPGDADSPPSEFSRPGDVFLLGKETTRASRTSIALYGTRPDDATLADGLRMLRGFGSHERLVPRVKPGRP
jgi:hypothetical protein